MVQGHRDVRAIFADLPRNSKTAPRARLCARFAPLYVSMAEYCKDAQLLPKRTFDAFMNINVKMRCNYTKLTDVELMEDCEKAVRIGFTKYRMLLNSAQYAITMADVLLLGLILFANMVNIVCSCGVVVRINLVFNAINQTINQSIISS